jgi:hypothetical protein
MLSEQGEDFIALTAHGTPSDIGVRLQFPLMVLLVHLPGTQ